MDEFDIIGQLYRKAKANGWVYLVGDNFQQNISATRQSMNDGQLILTASFNCNPTILNSRTIAVEYVGEIGLGLKFDADGTPANLDEEFMDKYNNRLLMLMQTLAAFIGTFECENGLSIVSSNFLIGLDRFDEDLDMVYCQITFRQQ